MKIAGGVMLFVGLMMVIVALFLPTSIETPKSVYVGGYLGSIPSGTESVYNLGLLQRQAMIFQAGLAATICGVVLLATGAVAALKRGSDPREHGDDVAAPVAVADARAGVTPVGPAPIPREDADHFAIVAIGVGLLTALLLAAGFWAASTRTATSNAEIEANARMLADNMEMMADNLEDLADNTVQAGIDQQVTAPEKFEAAEDEVPVCDRPDSPEKFALMNEIGVDCTGE